MREKIGGIVFPVRQLVRELKVYTKMRVDVKSGIYLAAVLEYLVKEVLELSPNALETPSSSDSNAIRSKHVRLIMKGDRELNQLTKHATIPIHSPKKKNEMFR